MALVVVTVVVEHSGGCDSGGSDSGGSDSGGWCSGGCDSVVFCNGGCDSGVADFLINFNIRNSGVHVNFQISFDKLDQTQNKQASNEKWNFDGIIFGDVSDLRLRVLKGNSNRSPGQTAVFAQWSFFLTPVIGLPGATIYLERERFQVLWNDSRHSSWILEIVIRHPLNWILCIITHHALGEGPGLDNCSLHLWCLHLSFWVSVLACFSSVMRNWPELIDAWHRLAAWIDSLWLTCATVRPGKHPNECAFLRWREVGDHGEGQIPTSFIQFL